MVLFFTTCFLISSSPSHAAQITSLAPGDYDGELMFKGLRRTYKLHIPSVCRRADSPSLSLVIALHGGGGNANNSISTSQLNVKADQAGFIVVHPSGTHDPRQNPWTLTWNGYDCCGYAHTNNIDDVGFISALIDELVRTLNIDRKKVYVTGLSNGALLAYRLACELATKIAAIAVVSGELNTNSCKPSEPVPVLVFHGTADQNIPYNGGPPTKGRQVDKGLAPVMKPVSFAISTWVNNNQCSSTPVTAAGCTVKRDTYGKCKNNADVVLYTIVGGGHAWPGGNPSEKDGDIPTTEISANDIMWEFFEAHPKL